MKIFNVNLIFSFQYVTTQPPSNNWDDQSFCGRSQRFASACKASYLDWPFLLAVSIIDFIIM